MDSGYGFPVIWRDIPVMMVDGEWIADADFTAPIFFNAALVALAIRKKRLTGRDGKVIRQSWHMSMREFARRFAVQHQAVMKWERSGDEVTAMEWATEKDM